MISPYAPSPRITGASACQPVLLGKVDEEIGDTNIFTEVLEASSTCLEIAGNDWHGSYSLVCTPHATTTAALYKGSFASNSFVQIISREGTQAPILQQPNIAITKPAETTKSNTEAIKTILEALGI